MALFGNQLRGMQGGHGGLPSISQRPPVNPVEQLQQALGALSNKVLQLEQALSMYQDAQQEQSQLFPEQFHAGVVAYPDRYPFPMVLDSELFASDGTRYGVTNDIVRSLLQVDVDNPTFITHVSFDLYKTDNEENTGLIGIFLPLSFTNGNGLFDPTAAFEYQGRDFRWRFQTSSDDRIWQTGWRSSVECDGVLRRGYKLPVEYELRRNDTLIIEAQPIAPAPAPTGPEWSLSVHLHVYKMLKKVTS